MFSVCRVFMPLTPTTDPHNSLCFPPVTASEGLSHEGTVPWGREQRNFSAAYFQTQFNPSFPPMQCQLCPAWRQNMSPSCFLGDKTVAGSAWGGSPVTLSWAGFVHSGVVNITCQPRAFKSNNICSPFHLWPFLPCFISSSVPALKVFWSPALNPEDCCFPFLQLQLQCCDGNPFPTGSNGHQCWGTMGGERRAEAAGNHAPDQQQWAAVCHPVPLGLDMHTTHHSVGSESRSGCPVLKNSKWSCPLDLNIKMDCIPLVAVAWASFLFYIASLILIGGKSGCLPEEQ